jgi:hypothetical protein
MELVQDRDLSVVCVFVCGPFYVLVYPIVTGHSSCCVLYVAVYGSAFALFFPLVTDR